MNCKHCDYPLWNIRNRQCPECGAAFAPSDFSFIPNSVCFCCPHCDQTYYGIGERGHLEPRQFECLKCQKLIDMDDMVLRPAAGVDIRATQPDRMPWLERAQRGNFKAWFATIGAAMTRPSNLIRAVPKDHSVGAAWLFMFVSNLIFAAVGGAIPLLFSVVFIWIMSKSVPGMGAMTNSMFMQSFWQLPFQLIMLAVAPPLWALLTHLLLMIGNTPVEKFSRTAHCIYYSSAANALTAIPCGGCSQLAGKIWWLVSAILMVKEAQCVSGGRATFAVLVSGIIVWGGTAVVAVGVAFMSMGLPGAGGLANFGANFGSNFVAQSLWSELSSHASAHNGYGPKHAIELLNSGSNPSFIQFTIVSSESSVPVGDTNLQQFKLSSVAEQRDIINDLVANQPANIVAHRLGDVIFTYHGIDFTTADRRLWAFILSPQPNQQLQATPLQLTIARLDGSTYQFGPEKFAVELEAQNRFRQIDGLPPLPADVLSVVHGTPAVALPTGDNAADPPLPSDSDDEMNQFDEEPADGSE